MFERIKKALQNRNNAQADEPLTAHTDAELPPAQEGTSVPSQSAADPTQNTARSQRDTKPSKELRNALIGLKFFNEALYESAVAYVHDGSQPEVLTLVASTTDKDFVHYFTMPGQIDLWFRGAPTFNETLKSRGLKATGKDHYKYQRTLTEYRRVFYQNETDPLRVARMGRLLAQVGDGPNRPIKLSPPFLHALVNDFVAVAPEDADARKAHFGERSNVSVGLIEAAARSEGVDLTPDAMIELLFQRDINWWGNSPLPYALAGAKDYLATHSSELSPTVVSKSLTAFGKNDLLERLHRLPEAKAAAVAVIALLAGDSAKGVRETAIDIIEGLPTQVTVPELEAVVMKIPASRAGSIMDFLALSDVGQAAIGRVVESGAKAATLAKRAQEQVAAVTNAIEETQLELPPVTPLKPLNEAALRADINTYLAREMAQSTSESKHRRERADRAKKVTQKDIDEFIDVCAGRKSVGKKGKYFTLPGIPDHDLIRSLRSLTFQATVNLIDTDSYGYWLLRGKVEPDMDLRAIEQVYAARGRTDPIGVYYGASGVDAEHAWPWFTEHTDVLTDLIDSGVEGAEKAVDVIAQLPVIPPDVLQVLASRAMGSSKIARKYAQQALLKHPAALTLAVQGLGHSTSDAVIAAAQWLGKQKNPEAIAPITTALAKEKRELVRAALLGALKDLGADLTEYLTPDNLLAAATKGLKAKVPASMSWFPFDSVPSVRWANGEPVAPEIIKWWIVSADKMKSPDGSGIIGIYLQLLDQGDREDLSRFVVQAWIARDTEKPSEADAMAYAQENGTRNHQYAQQHLARMQSQPDGPPQWVVTRASLSLDYWIKESYNERRSEFLGSAQVDKGLLAFGVGMPGVELGDAFLSYNRNNKSRRAQIDALVTSLYGNGQAGALQVLMAVARRHHQRTVQDNANVLVERVAEDRGWSTDELADRTIPTAGFDDDGVLRLSFGDREFTGRMTQAGLIELSNPAGKAVKALPKPGVADDEEVAGASRKQLTVSRKELKALVGIQTSRLYEAMCAEREWSLGDWTQFLRNHPVMARLISRVVWIARADDQVVLFRPTDDGELLGIDDEPVELVPGARISVAHGVAVDPGVAALWRQHVVDYEVAVLFDQFSHPLPGFVPGQLVFDDLQGHLTDSFSFRGVVTKRGYQRGASEDAGWFYSYTKDFRQLGLTVELEFTGAFLPEEDITCATRTLAFRNRRGVVAVSDVPGVLVAEAYADYRAVAALGVFDPEWERKSEY